MKYWLFALMVQLPAFLAGAANYRIVASPSLQLEVYLDDVTDARPQSWCSAELPLRIVATGDRQPAVLRDFLPKVGSLLANQCATLNRIDWRMQDSNGHLLAQGSALKAANWSLPLPAESLPVATTDAPAADTTPWRQFSLLEGCHFRGYWGDKDSPSALFIAAKQGALCGDDGWLSGQSIISDTREDSASSRHVTFLQGFPLLGINARATERTLQITTVNNQRMVLNDAESPYSWLILPYDERQDAWRSDGVVAVQLAQHEAGDESLLNARLESASQVWSPWLAAGDTLTILLVDNLQPQLQDPAARAWRTITQEIH